MERPMIPTSKQFCPACGAVNQPQDAQCFACGVALAAPPASPALPSGHLLKGRYHLLKQIGQGGYGYVYKAEDTTLGKQLVAIKEMRPSGMSQHEMQEA